VAASADQARLAEEIYGDEVGYIGWQRPGFDLGLKMGEMFEANPDLKGLVMGQHGLINWADNDKACYELTLRLINQAAEYIAAHDKGADTFGGQKYDSLSEAEREDLLVELLPQLRGMVSQLNRFVGTVHITEGVLEFVNSHDAGHLAEIGTSCPDHFLRTKIKPLYVDWIPDSNDLGGLLAKLEAGLAQYRKDYKAYYEACKHPYSPAMRDPNPTVILIPGVGLIAWGKNKSESRVTAEFYMLAIQVMRGSEAISSYQGLPRQEAFDIEYWLLEEAKLQRMPPEQEMARRVVLVVGAGSGIGKEVAFRLAKEGAHTICVDLNLEAAQRTADELVDIYGAGIGVAGTGISSCGQAIGLGADIMDRESVRAMLRQAVLAYGGIDDIIVTAGIFVPPDVTGHIPDEKWALTYAINVTGAYIVADEARKVWEEQGLDGSLVLTTSVNAVVPKKGSLAYDTSKAAANHLVRELAIELAPLVRVNGLAPATVVESSSMFPRDRVISSLTKYNIDFDAGEDSDTLRSLLAAFYAGRTLTGRTITPEDQAEVAYLLCSRAFSRTTGQIIHVDGGLYEAFLR
jgi:rhamnulose-1-phosphate aldolase/alcohol dehydrogenase